MKENLCRHEDYTIFGWAISDNWILEATVHCIDCNESGKWWIDMNDLIEEHIYDFPGDIEWPGEVPEAPEE